MQQNWKYLHRFYLDNWLKIPLRNFTLRNCLFGSPNIVKHNDKG